MLVLVDESASPTLADRIGDALYEIELDQAAVITALVYDRDTWNDPLYQAMPLHQSIDREGVLL